MQHALSTDDAEETLRELHWLELFRDIVDQLKLDIQAAAMKWEVDFGKAPVVRGPWSDLHSILYNLLSNAIKYRADKRPLKVAIHTQLVGPQLVLTVKDNGRGIDLDAVGDRLFQARARFHDEEEGTGMGLYLVKQHVKALGGTIDVESRPDQGTSFRVFLPHAEA
jgi:signal transduction histidine kinase